MENKQHDLFIDNDLNPIIQKYNIGRITNFESLEQYFDLKILDDDNTPKIVCDHQVCMIFDNELFNETYLLDVVVKYLDEHLELMKSVEFVYIDDYKVRGQLFEPKEYEDYEDHDMFLKQSEIRNFEKEILKPGILIINPFENEISVFKEGLVPMDLNQITNIFIATKLK